MGCPAPHQPGKPRPQEQDARSTLPLTLAQLLTLPHPENSQLSKVIPGVSSSQWKWLKSQNCEINHLDSSSPVLCVQWCEYPCSPEPQLLSALTLGLDQPFPALRVLRGRCQAHKAQASPRGDTILNLILEDPGRAPFVTQRGRGLCMDRQRMCRAKVCPGLGNSSVCAAAGGEAGRARVALEATEGVAPR